MSTVDNWKQSFLSKKESYSCKIASMTQSLQDTAPRQGHLESAQRTASVRCDPLLCLQKPTRSWCCSDSVSASHVGRIRKTFFLMVNLTTHLKIKEANTGSLLRTALVSKSHYHHAAFPWLFHIDKKGLENKVFWRIIILYSIMPNQIAASYLYY